MSTAFKSGSALWQFDGIGSPARAATLQVAVVLLVAFVIFASGVRFPGLIREDGVYESATALSFGLAAIVSAWLCFKAWRRFDSVEKFLFPAVGIFTALGFLSEVSFGARMFGFSMPPMRGGGELDGVHDFAMIAVRWAKETTTTLLLVAITASVGTAGVLAYVLRAALAQLIQRAWRDQVVFGLALSTALLAAAVGLDTLHSRKVEALEEAFETVASLGILWSMVRRARRCAS